MVNTEKILQTLLTGLGAVRTQNAMLDMTACGVDMKSMVSASHNKGR